MQFDLTAVIEAGLSLLFPVVGIVATAIINNTMKDTQAATVLGNAVRNSLGAIEQATSGMVESARVQVAIPGVAGQTAVGVQYVLDHAGTEATRLGITADAIAGKISAQIGLQKIAAKIALPTVVVPGLAA